MIIFKGGCLGRVEFDARHTETRKADKPQMVRNGRWDFEIGRTHKNHNSIRYGYCQSSTVNNLSSTVVNNYFSLYSKMVYEFSVPNTQ